MKRFLLLVLLLTFGAAHAEEPVAIPTLKLPTLDGKTFDLSAQRGKWVVVNFWATWCNPCVAEMPDIDQFAKQRDDVAVIGLAYEDTGKQEIIDFLKQHPVSYPIAQIDVDAPPKDFAVPRALPTTYLIGPDGHIVKTFLGPLKHSDLSQAISAASQAK